jgi:hypothetical protein
MYESPRARLLAQQRAWAASKSLPVDERGYLVEPLANLREPLSRRTYKAFDEADGAELRNGPLRPSKMRALHSSSALAANFFDYWSERNTAQLLAALGVAGTALSLEFERKLPTGLDGNPPNLDLFIELTSGTVVGIESKFSEWLKPRSRRRPCFKPKYFPKDQSLWSDVGLPSAQSLAEALRDGTEYFRYFDAAQLLKHALGLAKIGPGRVSLNYVYFDITGSHQLEHHRELIRITARVGDEHGLRTRTNQQLFIRLNDLVSDLDVGYLRYLRDRYFP